MHFTVLFIEQIFRNSLWQKTRGSYRFDINFKVYDLTDWEANNCNTHIAQYLNIFLEKSKASADYLLLPLTKLLPLYKTFSKNKKRFGTSLATSFSAWFLKKYILTLCSVNWPNFTACLPLLLEMLRICVLQLFVSQVVTSKFWN